MSLNLDQIRALAQRVAASHGLDVVEVEYQGAAKFRTLRVFIEKNAEERAKLAARSEQGAGEDAAIPESMIPAGVLNPEQLSGVTHEDCTAFSRDFGTVLDVEELVPGDDYTLEVSSPGLDRKLSSPADYARFAGSLVKLQTFTAVAGNRHWQGRLVESGEAGIRLDLNALKRKGRGGKANRKPGEDSVEIAFSNIEKANLIPEF